MALSREKYKRLPDLYVRGIEVELADGSLIWMQALNPLERDEAQHDSLVARGRLAMALRSEHASEEREKVTGGFWSEGRVAAIRQLVAIKVDEHLMEAVQSVRNDPEWKERIEILDRQSDMVVPPEESEQKLLDEINDSFVAEVSTRQEIEREYLLSTYDKREDNDLIDEYFDVYIERRGNEVAIAEYQYAELWFAARCCEAFLQADGEYNHDACEGHQVQVWESKSEIRALPEDLTELLRGGMSDLAMDLRTAKNSVRQGSSSGSSPLPSEVEESTPSTPTEIHAEPLGTSLQPSATP